MGVPLDEHGDRTIPPGVARRLLPGVEHALAVIADPDDEDRPHTLPRAIELLREEAEWLKRNRDRRQAMPKYRKKPVVVEAVQITEDNLEEVGRLSGVKALVAGPNHPDLPRGAYITVEIETLEGTMRGDLGDYIITGVQGERYPCKPGIFEQTYEPVDEQQGGGD